MADRVHKPRPGAAVWVRYAVLGLIVGGMWLWNGDEPLWLHAVRMLAILLIVPPVASRLVAAAARRRGREMIETISIGRLVASKCGLIIIALVATELLYDRVAHLDLYVAAWLTLTLAVGGPAIHHHLRVQVAAGSRCRRRDARTARSTRGQ